MLTSTDGNGNVTTYTRDKMDRVTKVQYGDTAQACKPAAIVGLIAAPEVTVPAGLAISFGFGFAAAGTVGAATCSFYDCG